MGNVSLPIRLSRRRPIQQRHNETGTVGYLCFTLLDGSIRMLLHSLCLSFAPPLFFAGCRWASSNRRRERRHA